MVFWDLGGYYFYVIGRCDYLGFLKVDFCGGYFLKWLCDYYLEKEELYK